MQRKMNRMLVAFLLVLISLTVGCTSLQPYEKMYLNDLDMILAHQKIEVFEINFETYREGASGANGGKVGGGCGCN